MKRALGLVLMVIGLMAVFSGGFWALQGYGIIMWPPESFMLDRREWVTNGALTMVVGGALFLLGKWLR